WLEDDGRPERAELVRAQLGLDRERERALLEAHGQRWVEEEVGPGWLLRHSADWVSRSERVLERLPSPRLAAFRRGVVEALFWGLDEFLADGEDLLARLRTIRRVQPLDLHPRVTPDGWYFWSDRQYEEGREYHLPGMLYQYLPASPTSAS